MNACINKLIWVLTLKGGPSGLKTSCQTRGLKFNFHHSHEFCPVIGTKHLEPPNTYIFINE